MVVLLPPRLHIMWRRRGVFWRNHLLWGFVGRDSELGSLGKMRCKIRGRSGSRRPGKVICRKGLHRRCMYCTSQSLTGIMKLFVIIAIFFDMVIVYACQHLAWYDVRRNSYLLC